MIKTVSNCGNIPLPSAVMRKGAGVEVHKRCDMAAKPSRNGIDRSRQTERKTCLVACLKGFVFSHSRKSWNKSTCLSALASCRHRLVCVEHLREMFLVLDTPFVHVARSSRIRSISWRRNPSTSPLKLPLRLTSAHVPRVQAGISHRVLVAQPSQESLET